MEHLTQLTPLHSLLHGCAWTWHISDLCTRQQLGLGDVRARMGPDNNGKT